MRAILDSTIRRSHRSLDVGKRCFNQRPTRGLNTQQTWRHGWSQSPLKTKPVYSRAHRTSITNVHIETRAEQTRSGRECQFCLF